MERYGVTVTTRGCNIPDCRLASWDLPMSGHLFITRGDLLHLACDAILIPSGTDAHGTPGEVVEP